MRFLVHVLELLFDELRIDLRGTDVRVAEHFLDRTDIRAVFQQVRGKRMTQRMGRNILVDVRFGLIGLDDLPEALPGHTLAADVHKEGRLVLYAPASAGGQIPYTRSAHGSPPDKAE